MRHGYSDETSVDISAGDFNRFATDKVAYLATLLRPEWLEQQKKLSPTKWAGNARFHLQDAIESAQFSLRPAAVSEDQRRLGSVVVKRAKELLETLPR